MEEVPPVAEEAKAAEAQQEAAAAEEAAEEEADEVEDVDGGDDDDEAAEAGGAASGAAAAPSKKLQLKQAPKGGAGKKVLGATAASVAYHKYDVDGGANADGAAWKKGETVPYLFLARVFGRIEAESKRCAPVGELGPGFGGRAVWEEG
eukprot:2425578-Prymnesium_polylepis.1